MPAFFSPIANPGSWTLSITDQVNIPAGLRYAGYTFRGLHATRGVAENVTMPALGILRRVTDGGSGVTVVEVQVNPFPIRQIVTRLSWGLPTFYFIFPNATGLSFSDWDTAPGNEIIRMATDVTVVVAGQDRVVLDPAEWATQISVALSAASADASQWQPFVTAVTSATNSGPSAPVLALDHSGRPRLSGSLDVVFGSPGSEMTHRLVLDPSDGGDLQKTVARMHLSNASIPANLWGAASSLRLRPVSPSPTHDFQLVRLEDRTTASNEISVTPAQRHIAFTDLHDWFAEQFAIPVGQSASPLARFTRGNRITPLVNGPAYFDDLFRQLQAARTANGGFHLGGWAMFPETKFTRRTPDDPADLPLTLLEAAQRIGSAGGGCRFLPAQFFQLQPADTLAAVEELSFYLIVTGILILNAKGVSFARTDAAGAVVLLGLLFANTALVSYILSTGGRPLEPNKDAVDLLGAVTNSRSQFSPFPARVEDNPAAPPLSDFPFDLIFQVIRHFGIYHQKFAVVKTAAGFVGYCGGIDLNPDRLDNADHLNPNPYHDVHARVEGPAVRDLALTFEQRWVRDGGGDSLAFSTPAASDLGSPGTDAVQVARTYFAPVDPARRLDFAPNGDRTLADTLLQAIDAANEFIYIEDQYFTPPQVYQDALVDKVWNGTRSEIRKLVIALPGLTDQPFGELLRSGLVARLRNADTSAGGGIVHIGYPRRRYTVPDNELRASSGKLVLGEDLPAGAGINPSIVLGPKARLPVPPFWVAVEGELMHVYDESSDSVSDSDTQRFKRFKVDRGDETRLVKGGAVPKGARARAHSKGAAATVVALSNIYVHAKMMIVDDVFLSIGSANLNRRGLFHDGEANVFAVPQALKAAPENPVAVLRRQLWAEMFDLPLEMAAPLLQDPLAAARLFERSPFTGNRYVEIEAYPAHLMLGATTGDALVSTLLNLAGFTVGAIDHVKIFNGVVDPTSSVETAP